MASLNEYPSLTSNKNDKCQKVVQFKLPPSEKLKKQNTNNQYEQESDCVTLINSDMNEMQNSSVQFRNEFRNGHVNKELFNIWNKRNGKSKNCFQFVNSNKMKTILAVLTVLCFTTFVFLHITNITSDINEAKRLLQDERQRINEMEKRMPNLSSTDLADVKLLAEELQETKAQIAQFEELYATRHDNITDNHLTNAEQLKALTDRLDAKKKKLDDIDKTLRDHDGHLLLNYLIKDTLVDKIDLLFRTSVNGILIWKVTNFSKLVLNAKSGRKLEFLSDPFRTSQYGYSMYLSINPNGYDIGKGTHLSIYFHLMKGEMDDILKWPFRFNVTVTLMDQLTGNVDIAYNFSPDPKNISFQKPKSNNGPGYGWPKFISHVDLKSNPMYLRNDTMYIKCIVNVPTMNYT